MPNKTIYVSDGDLKLFQRAQELAGGNLSAAISKALRRFVDVEEGSARASTTSSSGSASGPGARSASRPSWSGEWTDTINDRIEQLPRLAWPDRQVRPPHRAQPGYWQLDAEGKPVGGWRADSGSATRYGGTPKEQVLEVVDTLEDLLLKVPSELYDIVGAPRASRPWRSSTSDAARRRRGPGGAAMNAIEVRAGLASPTASRSSSTRIDLDVAEGTVFALLGRTARARRPRSTSSRR